VALGVAFAYPLDASVHQAIRAGVARRQRGEPVSDPLRPSRAIVP
jgi:hypothetical protein